MMASRGAFIPADEEDEWDDARPLPTCLPPVSLGHFFRGSTFSSPFSSQRHVAACRSMCFQFRGVSSRSL